MQRVAVLASFSIELIARDEHRASSEESPRGRFETRLGGKGFNQAVAARRLGAEVSVAGRVGNDDFGRMFIHALEEEGIDHPAVVVDPVAGTGVRRIATDASGVIAVTEEAGANGNVSAEDWDHGLGAREYDDVAVSTFFDDIDTAIASLATGTDTATAFFTAVINAEKRDCMLLNASPLTYPPADLPRFASVIVLNGAEAACATGIEVAGSVEQAFQAAHRLRSKAGTVVITLGEQGAIAIREGTRVHVPAFDVPVIDASGVADAFCAAVAVRLDRDLAEALRFANAAAAIACTRPGAASSMPHRDETEALLALGKIRA